MDNAEVTPVNIKEAQENDEKKDAVESEGEDAANIADSCTVRFFLEFQFYHIFQKSDDDEISAPEDEGIHISEELNPAIFEALEKSENSRKRKIKWASKKRNLTVLTVSKEYSTLFFFRTGEEKVDRVSG